MDWNNFRRRKGARKPGSCSLSWAVVGGESRSWPKERGASIPREIHSQWAALRVSSERLAELVAANLVEHSTEAAGMIRLPHAGVAGKTASRQRKIHSTLSLVRKPDNSARQRHSRQGPPRPLT